MTMIQILADGAISGSWLLAIFAAITAFFFVRTLNKIDKRMNEHDDQFLKINKQFHKVTLIQSKMLMKLGGDDPYFEKLSDELNQIHTE